MSNSQDSWLQQAVIEAAQRHQDELARKKNEEIIEISVKIAAGTYDKAIAYVNVVIIAGYAGFFGIWSFTNQLLTNAATVWSAVLMGSSIFTFCSWEVFKMIYLSHSLRVFSNFLTRNYDPEQFVNRLEKIRADEALRSIRLYQYWFFILLLAVPTGVCAGLMLLYNFIAYLLGWPAWPQ